MKTLLVIAVRDHWMVQLGAEGLAGRAMMVCSDTAGMKRMVGGSFGGRRYEKSRRRAGRIS